VLLARVQDALLNATPVIEVATKEGGCRKPDQQPAMQNVRRQVAGFGSLLRVRR
jgi:hypothetical protein